MRINTIIDMGALSMTDEKDIARRRAAAVRTAWALGAVAALIFIAFILSGVLAN